MLLYDDAINHTLTTLLANAFGKHVPSTALLGLILWVGSETQATRCWPPGPTRRKSPRSSEPRKVSWCPAHRTHYAAQTSGQAILTQCLALALQLLVWEDHGQPPAWLTPFLTPSSCDHTSSLNYSPPLSPCCFRSCWQRISPSLPCWCWWDTGKPLPQVQTQLSAEATAVEKGTHTTLLLVWDPRPFETPQVTLLPS